MAASRSRSALIYVGKSVTNGLVFGAIWALAMGLTLTVWLITAARLVRAMSR